VRDDIAGRNRRIRPTLVEKQLATAPRESAQIGAVRIHHPTQALLGIGEVATDVGTGGCPVRVFVDHPAEGLGAELSLHGLGSYDPWIPVELASGCEAARDLPATRPRALVDFTHGSDLGVIQTALAAAGRAQQHSRIEMTCRWIRHDPIL